jgi:D-xylose transport system permease protein
MSQNPGTEAAGIADGSQSLAASDFSQDVGPTSISEAFKNYLGRVRGGDVGMLPALIGLVVLVVIFVNVSDKFLTKTNLANLITQAAPIVVLGMGVVFVLLLGEIDLSAGTSGGVSAAVMGIAITNGGDVKDHLGGPTFFVLVLLMVVAAALAGFYRIWTAVGFIVAGLIILFTHLANSPVIAILAAVCVGVAIGVLTGFMVAKIGIPSFVVTLALFLGWQGVLLQFVGTGASINVGQSKFIFNLESASSSISPTTGWLVWIVGSVALVGFTSWRALRNRRSGLVADPLVVVLAKDAIIVAITGLAILLLNQNRSLNNFIRQEGVPRIVPIVLVIMLGWTFVLGKTHFGRHLYAVGGNAEAARRAGINVLRIRITAFVICSGMAGLAGVIAAARTASIDGTSGGGNTLLFAVAAAVIGGTSLFGGKGKVRDALIGGLVIAIIPNGLGLKPNLPASYNLMITAAVLLLAAAADALSRRRARASGVG